MEALRKFCMKEINETQKNRNKVKIFKQKPSFTMPMRVKQSIMDTILWANQFGDINESKTQIIARLTDLHGEGRDAV